MVGTARSGLAGEVRDGSAWRGKARSGTCGGAGLGEAMVVWRGRRDLVRNGMVRKVMARQAGRVVDGHGLVRRGLVRYGRQICLEVR